MLQLVWCIAVIDCRSWIVRRLESTEQAPAEQEATEQSQEPPKEATPEPAQEPAKEPTPEPAAEQEPAAETEQSPATPEQKQEGATGVSSHNVILLFLLIFCVCFLCSDK